MPKIDAKLIWGGFSQDSEESVDEENKNGNCLIGKLVGQQKKGLD